MQINNVEKPQKQFEKERKVFLPEGADSDEYLCVGV